MSAYKHTNSLPDPRDWHWADIKAAVEKSGHSLASISKANGCKTRRTAGMAKNRHYPRMERAIADAIGVPPQLIWPSRYDELGNPIRVKYDS